MCFEMLQPVKLVGSATLVKPRYKKVIYDFVCLVSICVTRG